MKKHSDNGSTDQAPHSVEAEEAVLGSILLDTDALYEVLPLLRADDFFIVRNGWVYEAILRLHERGEQIDYVAVVEELRQQGRLNEIGGAAYITYLINHTPPSIYAETYARVVERAAIRRRLLSVAGQVATLAQASDMAVDVALDEAAALLASVSSNRQQRGLRTAREVVSSAFDRIEAARASQTTGIATGFSDLDRMLGGLQPSDLIIFAGRPGMGKTSWLLSMALNAMKAGIARPAIFSLEMSAEQLVDRWCAAESGIQTERMRTGRLTDDEFSLYTRAAGRLSELPYVIDDTASLTAEQFATKAARAVAEHRANLIIVDYLQLMVMSERAENRNHEISAISRTLKQTARKLNVPVLAAAQLNRAVEARQDKRPLLSDLRDSGSLEQDADIVMFITRDDAYNENSERPNQADIIIAKHRNGPTGVVTLYFRKELTQFANLSRKEVNLAGL